MNGASLKLTTEPKLVQIVPAVLAENPVEFGYDLKKLKFVRRLHIDIATPPFSPRRTLGLAQVSLPDNVECDLHLMLDHPERQIEIVTSLSPSLAIAHFETKGNVGHFFAELKSVGIKTGLALLPETRVEQARGLIKAVDHVLIFTGHLGYYGGDLREDCLPKIAEVKEINPDVEVSVDGGVNPDNARKVTAAGADVLVSGGFIVKASDPKIPYRQMMEAVE